MLVLFSSRAGSRTELWVVRLGSRYLYPLSPVSSPSCFYVKVELWLDLGLHLSSRDQCDCNLVVACPEP